MEGTRSVCCRVLFVCLFVMMMMIVCVLTCLVSYSTPMMDWHHYCSSLLLHHTSMWPVVRFRQLRYHVFYNVNVEYFIKTFIMLSDC